MKKIILALLMGFCFLGAFGQVDPVVRSVRFEAQSEAEMNAIPANKLQEGSVCYREDTDSLWRYNGTTWSEMTGSGLANVVEDTTPQLGGTLDAQTNSITGVNDLTFNDSFANGHTMGVQIKNTQDFFFTPNGTSPPIFGYDFLAQNWQINSSPIVTQSNASSLGIGGISNLVEDTTPQLGGNLDALGFTITNVEGITLDATSNGGLSTDDTYLNLKHSTITGHAPSPGFGGIYTVDDYVMRFFGSTSVAAASKNLGFDFSGMTTTQDMIFTDTDITWNGISLLSGGGGSSPPFDDNSPHIRDNLDNTKTITIVADNITTATNRNLTMPDADVNLGNLGASNLDLTDDYTWTGTHNFPNLTELNGTLKVIGNVTTHFGGLILYQNNASTQTGFLGYSGNSVRMSNVTSAQVLQLLDAGGADFNGNFTSDAFIKDGATSDDILLGDGTTTSLAGLGVGDPDQTLSLGGTGNKDLTISGTGGNTIDLTGVDGVDPDNIESDLTGQPTGSSAITNMVKISLADYNAGTLVAGTDYLIESSPAEVVATATIAMDGWKMYDDQTADAATITLSDCDPGETLTVYINRASAPTLAGTGLTFNQLPNTTAFAAATTMAIEFRVAYDGTTIDYYYVER